MEPSCSRIGSEPNRSSLIDRLVMSRALCVFLALRSDSDVRESAFNPGGEPILNYGAVGLEMLDETDLDLELIENTLFCKSGRETRLDKVCDEIPAAVWSPQAAEAL